MSVGTVQLRKAFNSLQQGLAGPPNHAQKDYTACSSTGPHKEAQEHGLHCDEAAVGAAGSGFAAVVAGPGRARGLKMAAGEICDRKAFALRKFEGLDDSLDFGNGIDCELVKWLPTTSDGAAVDSSLAHAWPGEPEGCQHGAEEDDGSGDRMALGLWSPQSSSASPGSRAQEELQSADTGPGVGAKHVGQAKQPDEDVDGASCLASRMPEIHSSNAGLGVGSRDPWKAKQPDEDVDANGRLAPLMRELHSADAGLGVDPKHPEKPKHPAEDVISAGRSACGARKLLSADVSLGACPEPTAKTLQPGEELHPRPPVLPRPAHLRRPASSRGRPARSLPPASCRAEPALACGNEC